MANGTLTGQILKIKDLEMGDDPGKGPKDQAMQQPLEAGKSQEMGSGDSRSQACYHLDFSPVRPGLGSDLQN